MMLGRRGTHPRWGLLPPMYSSAVIVPDADPWYVYVQFTASLVC
jgi:hypothetical protein